MSYISTGLFRQNKTIRDEFGPKISSHHFFQKWKNQKTAPRHVHGRLQVFFSSFFALKNNGTDTQTNKRGHACISLQLTSVFFLRACAQKKFQNFKFFLAKWALKKCICLYTRLGLAISAPLSQSDCCIQAHKLV